MTDKTKELLISAGYTFITGFLIVLVPQLDTITMESFSDGTLVGLLFASTRTGLKMLGELVISWLK